MGWDSAPPTEQELGKSKGGWASAPPTKAELEKANPKNLFKGLLTAEGRKRFAEASREAWAKEHPQGPQGYNESETGVEHFADSTLMGYLPQIQAATQPAVFGLMNKLTGQNVENDKYVDARDRNIQRLQDESAQNPKAAALGSLAGAAANSALLPLPMPAKLAGAKGLLAAAGKGGLIGAEYGALANPGDVKGKVSPVQASGRVEKTLEGARSGAQFMGGLALGGKAISSAPKLGKKLMSVFLGPSEQHIDYYLKNSQAVNEAKSLEELKGHVDNIVNGLRDQVSQGKASVDEAKSALKVIEQNISENRRESNFTYQVTKTQVNQALKDAKRSLEDAFKGKTQALKDVKPPLALAGEAAQAVKDLKGKIVQGSQEATETLSGNPEAGIEIFSPYRALKEARSRLGIAGQGPVTPEAQKAAAQIDALIKTVGSLPSKLSQSETKALIKQIDQSERAVYNSGEFTDDVGRAYKEIRQAIDHQLKAQNPKYAAKMKGVAEHAGLHSEAVGPFGEQQSAISNLNRIGADTAAPNRETLTRLGKATGRDFETPVNEYLGAQRTLKDPRELERIRTSLPEYAAHEEAAKASRMLEGPEAQREFQDKNLKGSGLLSAQEKQAGLLEREQAGLLGAEENLAPFSNISENTSENKIKGLLRAKSGEQVELKKQFEQLSKLGDVDFVTAVDNLRTKQAFSQGRMNGSRNVNLFALIVHGGVGAAGGAAVLGPPGAAIGAVMGGIVDHYGPAISKKILDGVIKMGENPSVQKIKALQIPQEAKAYLIQTLVRYQAENDKRN